ncbi:MAG: hypothetical protein WKF71_03005 [Pyrinomonadaceae bacterium]
MKIVPAGRYTIQAQTDGFSSSTKTVVITAGANSSGRFLVADWRCQRTGDGDGERRGTYRHLIRFNRSARSAQTKSRRETRHLSAKFWNANRALPNALSVPEQRAP